MAALPEALSDKPLQKVTRNDGSHIVLKRFLNEEELSELAEKCNDSLDVFRTYYPENMELEKAAMEEAMRLQVPHMVGHTRARIDA